MDLTGHRFGRLRVASLVPKIDKVTRWTCMCDCGGQVTVQAGNLRNGHTTSCGCLARETSAQTCRNKTTHGGSYHPLYNVWKGMIRRCTDQRCREYSYYGARGITVCDRWISSFESFCLDMGPRPLPSLSIERKNNNGNYEPANCKWGTDVEQANNRRSNTIVQYRGKSVTLMNAWREAGSIVGIDTAIRRISRLGWSPERAVETPAIEKYRNHRFD
jgi:hypothetical protein